MAAILLFGKILKTGFSIVFPVFQPGRILPWGNLQSCEHHDTLSSLMEANIEIVTVKIFLDIDLSKYGDCHKIN